MCIIFTMLITLKNNYMKEIDLKQMYSEYTKSSDIVPVPTYLEWLEHILTDYMIREQEFDKFLMESDMCECGRCDECEIQCQDEILEKGLSECIKGLEDNIIKE